MLDFELEVCGRNAPFPILRRDFPKGKMDIVKLVENCERRILTYKPILNLALSLVEIVYFNCFKQSFIFQENANEHADLDFDQI